MAPDAKQIGVVCRQRREAALMSMRQMGKEIGVHESTVSRFERGLKPRRDVSWFVAAYARVLEMEVSELWREILRE